MILFNRLISSPLLISEPKSLLKPQSEVGMIPPSASAIPASLAAKIQYFLDVGLLEKKGWRG